jgi:lysophospholipid acyltransferase (LPLAT)-like uncharacterized protein
MKARCMDMAAKRKRTTPRFLKPIIKSDAFQKVLSTVAVGYIRLVHATSRWTVLNDEIPRRYWDERQPFILAFWHSRLMMMPYCWDNRVKMNMLISQHRDGSLIADTVEGFGIKSVRGSTGKAGHGRARGGAAAFRSLVKLAAAGEAVGITPDGPRGPRMRSGEGIAMFARLCELPVVPVGYGTSRRIVLNTWDKFIVSLPFSRCAFVWGEPIHVASKDAASIEEARLKIENESNRVTLLAEMLVGAQPIGPEPLEGVAPAALEASAI